MRDSGARIRPVIRSASLTGYVALATELGLDPTLMLRRSGLSLKSLDDPETPVSANAVQRLLEASAIASGIEDFGLRLASKRRLGNLGPLASMLLEAPTARQALETLSIHLRLLNESLVTRIEDSADVVVIREELFLAGNQDVRQSIELAVGVMYRILKELLGERWRPRLVCFTHRPPRDTRGHRAVLATRVTFNAPFNGIVCDARDLNAQLPTLNTGLSQYALRYLQQANQRTRGSTVDLAKELIVALLPGGRCSATQVAQHLDMDRRTLHRHLLAAGWSFSALLLDVRRMLAARQLRESDRSLSELAGLLGFSGASAFAYWFRRQFGCSTGTWRATHLTQLQSGDGKPAPKRRDTRQ